MVLKTGAKVFCLGLSKTGTSSLSEALNLLGIRTVHYPHDAQTFEALRSGNYRLPILDEVQGLADLPVAPYYAQFDAHYPDSKFILTLREKESWLRSCETHWRLMDEWLGNFPNFKRVQEFASASTYGTVGFSRDRFSFVYDLHLRNVSEYFKARSNDLLLLDICGGEGWEKLCSFLRVAVPHLPFPHANEWMHLWQQAADDLERLVPEGDTLILVDEQGFGKAFARGRRCLPFLEREGGYWGAPPDGVTAVSEFERLRAEGGANFIAFGWPAFWWLDHYGELNAHLRTRFPCVLENARLVVFDLHRGVKNVASEASLHYG